MPAGTLAFDADTGDLLADLAQPGDTAVVARGGLGGGGNIHRASSINRTPTSAGPGEAGEERNLRLELRLHIDVALVGLPNSGKSTLLSELTAARPKIAPYAHSTTRPELGVMFGEHGEPVILCEIPSDEYLRHIDRARVVVLVVDASSPADLAKLRAKLAAVTDIAQGRSQLVVYTKSDLVAGRKRRAGCWVSAETGVGLEELRSALLGAVREAPPSPRHSPALRPTRLLPPAAAVKVHRNEEGTLELTGARLDRLLARYDLASRDGLDRFQVALDRMGINAVLSEAGAEPGDTVRIGESEFEYQP